MNVQAELADVQRRLRALQKKCSKRRPIHDFTQRARRCAPTSRACLFVFVQSGRATEVAVDFVSGRGWNMSCQLLDEQERQELAAEIEWAYIRAPLEDIVMLETKPQELCSWQDLVAGTRFIVEHMLFAWLQKQNVEQGLAPSRSQLVEQALANIPLLAPEDVKAYLNTILASSDRSQRRWLAKFRRRWGARLGMLKPCSTLSLKEKQSKVRKEVLDVLNVVLYQFQGVCFWVRQADPILGPFF